MKVYIAGKVSGLESGEVFVKFNTVAYKLKRNGYNVANPVLFCSSSWNWSKCMRVCIAELVKCDAIYLLPDWRASKGAKIEYFVAKIVGLKILTEKR